MVCQAWRQLEKCRSSFAQVLHQMAGEAVRSGARLRGLSGAAGVGHGEALRTLRGLSGAAGVGHGQALRTLRAPLVGSGASLLLARLGPGRLFIGTLYTPEFFQHPTHCQ